MSPKVLQNLLGYCVLPLYTPDTENARPIPRILADGAVELPMATQLAPHYLSPEGDVQSKVRCLLLSYALT